MTEPRDTVVTPSSPASSGGVRALATAARAAARRVAKATAEERRCALDAMAAHVRARETEILAWVARGKSNPLIAEILGISSHTVDAHLRRIYLKLGVFDRISAAVRGIGIGLIRGQS